VQALRSVRPRKLRAPGARCLGVRPSLASRGKRRFVLVVVPLVAAVLAAAWIVADRGGPQSGKRRGPPEQGRSHSRERAAPPPERPRLFSPSSFWNKPLADGAPLDPRSREIVGALRQEVAKEIPKRTGPWISTASYSTPLYEVPNDQPTVRVALNNPNEHWRRTLQTAFTAVPIPRDARPAVGTDGHLTIWQPSTDKLWEFWRARREGNGGWRAAWGGAIRRVSKSPGYYTDKSWPGSAPNWGASATSLPVIGGTMLIDELRRGRIDHALALAVPFARAGVFSRPAQRTDGASQSPNAIPEGARLRLDPRLDINRLALPRPTRVMAKAAQRYGMVVRDQTANAIAFYAEDPTPTGKDPYRGANGKANGEPLFEGKWPVDLLERFPWDHLQLLKMDLRRGPG
jgi:hypothetical protein